MIGRALSEALAAQGYAVVILTRAAQRPPPAGNIRYAQWDISRQWIDPEALKEADSIIHLAGANVGKGRWTKARKREIVESRVNSGHLLVKALRDLPNRVTTVISASAIGWYGPDPQVPNPRPFRETDPPDSGFLGQTCQQWEGSILPVEELDKRLVIFRIGLVFSNAGGAFAEFRKPLSFGVAPILGSGRQVISWIHLDDLVRLFLYALQNPALQGTYNAVAPQPVTNKNLMLQMAREKGFSLPVPVPSAGLRLALGEMSIEVLKSATVSARKVEGTGFVFHFPAPEQAVRQLMAARG